ncbi:hypothetical protein D9M68_546080 [compost metagenome]
MRHALLRLEAGHHFRLELLAAVVLDVHDLAAIAELGERDGQAIAAGTAGAADAVGVVLGLHRQAEVEDVGDGRHVDAAGGNVGGHQDLHLALAQCHQAAVAQALAQGAVQRDGAEAFLLQVVGEAVALDLRAGEHDRLVDAGVAQPVVEQLALVLAVVGPVQRLLDVGVLLLRAVDGDALRLAHDALGQLLDARREGGAEHHGLLALDGELVDFSQVVGKAEVEHAVGFVDHQELDLVELELLRALQVEQAAGGGDHEVGVLQLGDLQLVRHTTHHVGHAQATAMAHQVDGVVGHLLGEFARGAQDQGAGGGSLEIARAGGVFALGRLGRRFAAGQGFGGQALALGAFLGVGIGALLQQGVQHRQQEGGGLAAAGLAGDHQVGKTRFAFGQHGLGNHIVLHLGGLHVAEVGTGLHQLGCQTQQLKTVGFGRGGGDRGVRFGFGRQDFGREIAAGFKRVAHVRPCAICAIDRIKTLVARLPCEAGGSSAPDPFVVTKHQPSNGLRAMGPTSQVEDTGSEGPIRNANGGPLAGWQDVYRERRMPAQRIGEPGV